MRRRTRWLAAGWVVVLAAGPLLAAGAVVAAGKHHRAEAVHGSLEQQMEAILADPALAGVGIGIRVEAMDGTVLYGHNDGERFAAASNTKLLTTAAAMALLGPRFRVTTRVVAAAGVAGQTVRGDLVLVGAGDTSLSARVLPYNGHTERTGDPLAAMDDLAAQVVRAGVREVTGNVVGDDSWFAWQPWPTGWEWNDLQWEYGAAVSALVANDNVAYLTITPGAAAGEPASYAWLPQVEHFTVESTVQTVASGPGVKPRLGASREPNSTVVRLWGTVPVNAQPWSMALAVDDPAVYAAEALKERLVAAGVKVDGRAVARHRRVHEVAEGEESGGSDADGVTAGGSAAAAGVDAVRGTVVASRVAPPLVEDLVVTNKVSQNLHAEVALLQLAAQEGAGTRQMALAAERRFLLSAGLAGGDFLVFDGSGLSRDDMVAPRALTALLRYAAGQPWGPAWKATLPVGGVDGTLSTRFASAPLKGNVFAKTGSLNEDASLSGYVVAASGRTVVFSILCNRKLPGAGVRAVMDRMVAVVAAAE